MKRDQMEAELYTLEQTMNFTAEQGMEPEFNEAKQLREQLLKVMFKSQLPVEKPIADYSSSFQPVQIN